MPLAIADLEEVPPTAKNRVDLADDLLQAQVITTPYLRPDRPIVQRREGHQDVSAPPIRKVRQGLGNRAARVSHNGLPTTQTQVPSPIRP